MVTELIRSRPEPFGYDPICGSRLPALYRVNPYSDDQGTYFFCSGACRRFFLEHGQLQRVAGKPLGGRPGTVGIGLSRL
jgi:YHS domain-containing protein